jgi:DASS family divalent anion:Na+ symporter
MAVTFVGLIVMWVLGAQIGVDATQAAAIGVSVMLLTGVLTWQDALAEKSAWDTMIWIGILIMLAGKLNDFGLISWVGSNLAVHLNGYHRLVVLGLVAAIYFYSHYLFASATAHIGALYTISLTLLVTAGVAPFPAAMLLGCLSSLYGCLTQYAIGSGPVMFGAGYVSQGEWWKTGFCMSLIYMVIWLTVGPLWWTLLGLTHVKF